MKRVVGIDIGGSNIRVAVFESERAVFFKIFKTPKSKEKFLRLLRKICNIAKKQEDLTGVGISIAGAIEKEKIIRSPNVPYLKNFNFRNVFPRPIRLSVDNDARAFARAELRARRFMRGARSNSNNVKIFAFTLGTGIGRAYGENGKIKKIKRFEYPEKWEREYQAVWDKNLLASYLAKHLAPFIFRYRPDIIVFGGGVSAYPGFFKKFKRLIKKYGIRGRVELPKLPKYAGAWGAALLVI